MANIDNRYARVLFVSRFRAGEADPSFRIAEVLRAAGHAVHLCSDPTESHAGCNALRAVCEAFSPTVLMWDIESVSCDFSWFETVRPRCLCVAVVNSMASASRLFAFDAAVVRASISPDDGQPQSVSLPWLPLSPACDEAYSSAIVSDASLERRGILLQQEMTDERRCALQSIDRVLGCQRYVSLFASGICDGAFECAAPGTVEAYLSRSTRFALFFAGSDAPSASEVAMRVAEGNLVFAEEKLVEECCLAGMVPKDCMFTVDTVADVLASALSNDERCHELLDAERQALGRLDALETSLSSLLSSLNDLACTAGMPHVLAFDSPVVPVVFYGWLGAENFGDDLLLRLAASRLQSRYDMLEVRVIGANPHVIRTTFGYQAASPDEKDKIRQFVSGARSIVYLGGLLFDQPMALTAGELEFCFDPWIEPSGQAACSLLASSAGARPVFLGIGGGPISYQSTKRAIRMMGWAGGLFLPRDEETARLVSASGVPAACVQTKADLSFGFRDYLESRTGGADFEDLTVEGDYFIVSLRSWHQNPDTFVVDIAAAVDWLYEATGCKPLFLPFDTDDVVIHREVLNEMRHADVAVFYDRRPCEMQFYALIAHSRFAFAMRLHCSALHHVLGIPAIGLSYNEKIRNHFAEIGQLEMLLPLSFTQQELKRAAAHLDNQELHRKLLDETDRKAKLVDEAYACLFEVIDSWQRPEEQTTVFYPRRVSRFQLQLEEERAGASRERDALIAERDTLRQRVTDLEQSHSYRVGSALMYIPGKLKRLLGR